MPKWLIYSSALVLLAIAAFSEKQETRKKLATIGIILPIGLLLIGAAISLRSVEGPKTPLIPGQ